MFRGAFASERDIGIDTGGNGRYVTRNLFRSLLGLVLAAAATWLANELTNRIFGLEDAEEA